MRASGVVVEEKSEGVLVEACERRCLGTAEARVDWSGEYVSKKMVRIR